MDSAARQQIMGFFIEESQELMVTLEQGLPELEERIFHKEAIDELVRAAHSIKGGAAMLGISSIKETAMHLEMTLGAFRDRTVSVDSQGVSLLLSCHKTLDRLFQKLQSPAGLTSEEGAAELAKAEPVFEALDLHLKGLRGEIPARTTAEPVKTHIPRIPPTLMQSPPRPEAPPQPAPATSTQSSKREENLPPATSLPSTTKPTAEVGFFGRGVEVAGAGCGGASGLGGLCIKVGGMRGM